jgi:hypothetical protein
VESRLLAWLTVACTVVIATPTARQLWAELRTRREALADQRRAGWAVSPRPDDLRDLYDSTR